jgi:hypothetical protein
MTRFLPLYKGRTQLISAKLGYFRAAGRANPQETTTPQAMQVDHPTRRSFDLDRRERIERNPHTSINVLVVGQKGRCRLEIEQQFPTSGKV